MLDSIPFYLFVAALAFALQGYPYAMHVAMIATFWTTTGRLVRGEVIKLSGFEFEVRRRMGDFELAFFTQRSEGQGINGTRFVLESLAMIRIGLLASLALSAVRFSGSEWSISSTSRCDRPAEACNAAATTC